MRSQPFRRHSRQAFSLGILAAAAVSHAQTVFTLTDLGSLGAPGSGGAIASAINNAGQIVGWSSLDDAPAYPGIHVHHAFFYQNGSMVDLGALPPPDAYPTYSAAFDINDAGQIVGQVVTSYANGTGHAARFTNPGIIDFSGPSGDAGNATAINNAGVIVGTSTNSAFLCSYAGVIDTPFPAHLTGSPNAINDAGQVVGWHRTPTHDSVAFVHDTAGLTPLHPFDHPYSVAHDINNTGNFVGESGLNPQTAHAFVFRNGSFAQIPAPPGRSVALAINDFNDVVGWQDDLSPLGRHAFYYNGKSVIDLNHALLAPPGFQLLAANDINNAGQIVGYGRDPAGINHAYLLTPIHAKSGDANLDGRTDPDDYAAIDRGFAAQLTGWIHGDFNTNGVIDAQDYLLIDQSFALHSGGTLSASLLSSRRSQFGQAYVTALLSSLPDPASASCFFALLPLMRRRHPGPHHRRSIRWPARRNRYNTCRRSGSPSASSG